MSAIGAFLLKDVLMPIIKSKTSAVGVTTAAVVASNPQVQAAIDTGDTKLMLAAGGLAAVGLMFHFLRLGVEKAKNVVLERVDTMEKEVKARISQR